MNAAARSIRDYAAEVARHWDRFWFTPSPPHTLALIRIGAGLMLFYTHLVWALDLTEFLGPSGWLPNDLAREMHSVGYAWSHLWYIQSPAVLWTLHILALIVLAMFTAGVLTRVTAVLSWLITVAYAHRLTGAFFGLDQVNAMLAMYLMLAPSGAVYSLDRWWSRRGRGSGAEPKPTVSANVATRLIQLHMCIIYLFGGISKMRGQMWWDGSAVWYAVANYEYQSLDMTWLAAYPWLIALLTHVTVLWETYYCFLIWHRLTRPIMLALAVFVHGGIGLFLGMITFGLVMLIGNLAFVPPEKVQWCVNRCLGLDRNARQSSPSGAAAAAPAQPAARRKRPSRKPR